MPGNKSLQQSSAALKRVAMEGGEAVSRPAREAKWRQLLNAVNPDGDLSEAEATKRAQALRRSEMTALAAKSIKARQGRAAAAELREIASQANAAADAIEADAGDAA